jgi:hypothetical protein
MAKFVGQDPAKVEIQPGAFRKIMLVGIQGTGKTTSSVKLARFFSKRGLRARCVRSTVTTSDQSRDSCLWGAGKEEAGRHCKTWPRVFQEGKIRSRNYRYSGTPPEREGLDGRDETYRVRGPAGRDCTGH